MNKQKLLVSMSGGRTSANFKQMQFTFDDEEDSGCSESCEAYGD